LIFSERAHLFFILKIMSKSSEDAVTPAVPPAGKSKFSFETYSDPTGEFKSSTLKYGFWFVQNRLALYRLVVGVLILISVALFGFAAVVGYQEINVALNDRGQFNQALRDFPDYTLVQERFAPQALQITETTVFSGGVDKYDLVAQITNPNQRFSVSFDYSFSINGQSTVPEHTTLLAGESRPVSTLGVPDTSYPGSPQLVLSNIQWKRISSHKISDPLSWQAERLAFTVSDFKFVNRADQDGANAATITFTLTNNTAYGYVSPHFYVGFYSQDSLVGVAPLQIEDFPSLTTKKIDIRSFASNVLVSDVKVFPLINVYDHSAYLPAK
jgi:hypothetical protein